MNTKTGFSIKSNVWIESLDWNICISIINCWFCLISCHLHLPPNSFQMFAAQPWGKNSWQVSQTFLLLLFSGNQFTKNELTQDSHKLPRLQLLRKHLAKKHQLYCVLIRFMNPETLSCFSASRSTVLTSESTLIIYNSTSTN